ncbi:MAG: PEP-CTERM sorting domain-containing protein [Limisphaerales bacterium]
MKFKNIFASRFVFAFITSLTTFIGHAELLVNGGLEDPSLIPWVASGDASATSGSVGAQEGVRYVNLTFASAFFSGSSLSFSQSFNLPSAAPLSLKFFAQRYDPTSGQNDVAITFLARIDAVVLTSTIPPFSGSAVSQSGWASYDLTSSFLSSGPHTLTFDFTRGSSLFGRSPILALDGVSINPVPEPATSVLLGIGLTVALLARLRRRSLSA